MSLYIVDYSEKAIAIFGDTKYYKNKLSEIQGKFNASLNFKNENGETEKKAGWIFPKVRKDMVQQVVNDINSGKIEKEPSLSNKPKMIKQDENKSSLNDLEEKSSNRDYVNISSLKEELFKDFVPKRDFMNLVSKIERLEQEIYSLRNKEDKTSNIRATESSIKKNNKDIRTFEIEKKVEDYIDEDYIDEEEEKPKRSLLRGKK
jgi:hypothetical protein